MTTFQVYELKNRSFLTQIPNTKSFFLIEGDDGYPKEEISIIFGGFSQWSIKKSITVNINKQITIDNLFEIGKMIQKEITEKIFDSAESGEKTL